MTTPTLRSLLESTPVADWRQIQARIRKARSSSDPVGQLTQIYEQTRDAMVAFELARLQEKAGQNAEAARWYTAAAERFRRAQWKTKAQEALARLGVAAPVSEAVPVSTAGDVSEPAIESAIAGQDPTPSTSDLLTKPEPAQHPSPRPSIAADGERYTRARRGRRGGRGRGRGRAAPAGGLPQARAASAPPTGPEEHRGPEPAPPTFESAVGPAAFQARARASEPALASRLAQLESQLRRLVAGTLHRFDEADEAPAGPGVFILSDADLSTHYYIEACQTLRIGIGKILRSERASRGGSLKAAFAEHLGISESRVPKYIKEHCVVRWQQLDEGASPLAHFAIAVLKPVLNE